MNNNENNPAAIEEKKRKSISEFLNISTATAPAFIIAAIALIFSMASVAGVIVSNLNTSEPMQIEEVKTLEPIHQHTWIPNVKSVHHDPEIKTVEHEAVWENMVSYHTVCNECNTEIDGIANQHIADTGHSGFTTNVPISKPVLVSDAWTEDVVVTEAYDETITDGSVCAECGETKAFVSPSEVH